MTSKDCAIFFDNNAYSIDTAKLMGRNSAGASFLKGYFINGKPENFWVYAKSREEAQVFADLLDKYSSRSDANYIPWNNFLKLKRPGNIFYPAPDFNALAWQRRYVSESAWSICGITHTTASSKVMDSIGDYYTAPIKKWDALICTSNSVKQNVEFILEGKKKYLFDDLGLRVFDGPRLPIIPLGINTKDYEYSQNDKNNARTNFNINEDVLVIAYVGRLSFHAKANPIAMYAAIEKAARLNPKKRVKIIECGWFSNDWIRKSFSELAKQFLTEVDLIHVDGRNQDNVRMVWQSADIFCSFSDNIQETFGISPLEAMASGLPVVVSDWDGYKENVRDNMDGFRIPTVMPEGGLGNDLAISHGIGIDTYDAYIGKSSAFVAIDIEEAANKFDQLMKSDELRIKFGANAKKRAVEVYDWKNIIPQYENLWLELSEERNKFASTELHEPAWPTRPDPFFSFAHYATNRFDSRNKFEFVFDGVESTVKSFKTLKNMRFASLMGISLPTDEEFLLLFHALGKGASTAQILLLNFEESRRSLIYRSLFWLLKIGILKLSK